MGCAHSLCCSRSSRLSDYNANDDDLGWYPPPSYYAGRGMRAPSAAAMHQHAMADDGSDLASRINRSASWRGAARASLLSKTNAALMAVTFATRARAAAKTRASASARASEEAAAAALAAPDDASKAVEAEAAAAAAAEAAAEEQAADKAAQEAVAVAQAHVAQQEQMLKELETALEQKRIDIENRAWVDEMMESDVRNANKALQRQVREASMSLEEARSQLKGAVRLLEVSLSESSQTEPESETSAES